MRRLRCEVQPDHNDQESNVVDLCTSTSASAINDAYATVLHEDHKNNLQLSDENDVKESVATEPQLISEFMTDHDDKKCDAIGSLEGGLEIHLQESHTDENDGQSSSVGSVSIAVNTSLPITEKRQSIGHYSSHQKILLVGEGDFSFAASLATAFGSAINLTATSFDCRDTVVTEYSRAATHLLDLEERGVTVIHEVDVCTMDENPQLENKLFDRIVFNFPHSGDTCYEYWWKESDSWYIKCHQAVVRGFLETASLMLSKDGEIHITHKTTNPYDRWEIEDLAEFTDLVLTSKKSFDITVYPGYENKKAYGLCWDSTFPVGQCSTFIFSKP